MSESTYTKLITLCFLKDLAYAGLFIKMYSMNAKWWLYLLVLLTFPFSDKVFKGGEDECNKST